MQNKGLVKWTAIALLVICAYYLSFTVVSAHYSNKAKEYAQGDVNKEIRYLDSLSMKKVWAGQTLKEVRQNEIGLGLDLKGGMNVVLELNSAEVLENLSGHSQDPTFLKAIENAKARQERSQEDFISLFIKEFHALDPGARLSAVFGTLALKDKINASSTDAQVETVLRAQMKEAIESSHKVLRNRIDRFGVVSPNIQKLEGSDRILVELPGVKEPQRVRNLLQGSANLEFWETYLYPEVMESLMRADKILASANANAPVEAAPAQTDSLAAAADTTATAATASDLEALVAKADTAQADLATAAEKKALAKTNPLFALLSPVSQGQTGTSAAVVGFAHATDRAAIDSMLNLPRVKEVLPRNLKLLWGVKELTAGSSIYELYAIKVSRRDGQAALLGEVVTNAESIIEQKFGRQEPSVSMTMNAEGTREWARLTRENVNRPIAIVLDNVVYSAPNVLNEIPNGTSSITGNFTVDESTDLANTLKSGKMAASVKIVQEDVVGPSLGAEAIRAGLISFVIALLVLFVYMCMLYGLRAGMVVDGALLVNLFLTMGILASLHAVMTLAGIAGLVLSIGMAVDANVLVFERIKEELKAGKTVIKAISEGYNNALSAILDSNVTTILTGIILYYFGSGPIRGFATTLIIGILCSFLTAVFLTRIVFEGWAKKGKMDNMTFETSFSKKMMKETHIDFMGMRKGGFIISLGFLVAGAIALGIWGLNPGVEFTGGRNYIVKFDKPVSTADVDAALNPVFDGKVSVIRISTEDQVRISTNYRVEENTPEVDTDIQQKLYEGLKPMLGDGVSQEAFETDYIKSSQKVGASMADDIKQGAVIAVILSLIVMAIYILIRFRDIAFSIGAFASVTFTTLSIIAFYALVWKIMPFTMEVDLNFIAAVLTIIGYSINDTIVIFDRIREILGIYPNKDRKQLFNESLNITLNRTIYTGTSSLIVITIIFIFGGASIRSFTFAIILGILFGTFSTLFIASPIAYLINRRNFDKKKLASSASK